MTRNNDKAALESRRKLNYLTRAASPVLPSVVKHGVLGVVAARIRTVLAHGEVLLTSKVYAARTAAQDTDEACA